MGKAWVFGDNVDTDALAPGKYMKFGIEEILQPPPTIVSIDAGNAGIISKL